MLSDSNILKELAAQREDVRFEIVTKFTDSRTEDTLNRRVFKSMLLPVPPPLCFFETWQDSDLYGLSSFFAIPDPQYSIIPFGTKKVPAENMIDYGISYNVFLKTLPIQSYTVAIEGTNIPLRGREQANFFKETNVKGNAKLWSAGHLIAHRYTPPYLQATNAATLQYDLNFIPEPARWNLYQRNHLENRCAGRYYGVYPIYHLRYVHGRTVNSYAYNSMRLSYRPVPDGELFVGRTNDTVETRLYMPFVDVNNKVYDSKVSGNYKCQLDVTVQNHKVNKSAFPEHVSIDFARNLKVIVTELDRQIKTDESLALQQGNLFLTTNTNPLHHAAIIQYERSATKEFMTPKNKMECALIFSDLGNSNKTKLYLKAIRAHGKILLDKCEAENPPVALFSNRLFKLFKSKFPDEDQSIDQLRRLVSTYSA